MDSRFGQNAIPDTFYAKSDDVHIAYQVITGSGALDLVTIPPGVSNIEVFWEQPLMARFLRVGELFADGVLRQARERDVRSFDWPRDARGANG